MRTSWGTRGGADPSLAAAGEEGAAGRVGVGVGVGVAPAWEAGDGVCVCVDRTLPDKWGGGWHHHGSDGAFVSALMCARSSCLPLLCVCV